MDWVQFAYLAAGLVGGALAKHIMSGKPPVVDPNNQRPLVDSVRDIVRAELVALFGGSATPAPAPAPVPVVPVVPASPQVVDPNALLQILNGLLSQAMTHVAAANQVAPAPAPEKPAA